MTYYNPLEVVQRGTRINQLQQNERPFVREGEILVGIMDNGAWVIAPDLTDGREFKHFYEQYSQGYWVTMGVYALPNSELPSCQNRGQVNPKDLERILKEHPPKTENRH